MKIYIFTTFLTFPVLLLYLQIKYNYKIEKLKVINIKLFDITNSNFFKLVKTS